MEKRTRPNQLKIRLSDKELSQVRQKYGQSRSKSMRHFVLKCILETSIYEVDMQPFRELQHLLSKTSTNVNQIAKKVNTYSLVYKEDIKTIQNEILFFNVIVKCNKKEAGKKAQDHYSEFVSTSQRSG